MLAKNVNDNACILDDRSVFEFFASKLAPTSGILNATSKPWAYPKNKAATTSSVPPHTHTHTPVGASKLAPTSGVLIRR